MGLFSRNTPADKDEDFDEIDLPSSTDLKANLFTEEEQGPKVEPVVPATRRVHAKTGYGIEDAIQLMKDLPRDNNEVVVTVVKKTLESTHIQVQDIVADATAKEERIRQQHKSLEEEIKNLQEQISQRNQQITELLRDLKETTDVRQRLQLAMELEAKRNPPKPEVEPKTASTATVSASTSNQASTSTPSSAAGANPSTAGSNTTSNTASNATQANSNAASPNQASGSQSSNGQSNNGQSNNNNPSGLRNRGNVPRPSN